MNPLVFTEILKNVNIKKIAMYLGGALLLVIMALYVRKKINEAREERAAEQKIKEYNESIETAIAEGDLSYPDADYKIMADQIFMYLIEANPLNGGLLGVNQNGIYSIMEKMNTNADVYKLIEAFGVRDLRPPYKLWGKQPHTLPTAFAEVLFKGEREKVNEILAEKGLTVTF